MTRPGMPANSLPPNNASMMRRIQDLERGFKMLQGARTLENASIGAGGLQVNNNGDIVVNGGRFLLKDASGNVIATLDDTGITVAGQETVQGTLTVTGDTAIEGTLSLPNGIIDNAALANPIEFGNADASASSLNLPATASVLVSANISVPSGFTTAALHITAELGCTATASAAAGMYAQASVTAPSVVDGDVIASGPLAGQSMSFPATLATVITGLSGGTITVAVKGNYYGSAPAANSGNAHVAALAIFTR